MRTRSASSRPHVSRSRSVSARVSVLPIARERCIDSTSCNSTRPTLEHLFGIVQARRGPVCASPLSVSNFGGRAGGVGWPSWCVSAAHNASSSRSAGFVPSRAASRLASDAHRSVRLYMTAFGLSLSRAAWMRRGTSMKSSTSLARTSSTAARACGVVSILLVSWLSVRGSGTPTAKSTMPATVSNRSRISSRDESGTTPPQASGGQAGRASSIAATRAGSSGATIGLNRVMLPSGPTRNFSKFQRMSPSCPSASATAVSSS
jgi:hypothetical protein